MKHNLSNLYFANNMCDRLTILFIFEDDVILKEFQLAILRIYTNN